MSNIIEKWIPTQNESIIQILNRTFCMRIKTMNLLYSSADVIWEFVDIFCLNASFGIFISGVQCCIFFIFFTTILSTSSSTSHSWAEIRFSSALMNFLKVLVASSLDAGCQSDSFMSFLQFLIWFSGFPH